MNSNYSQSSLGFLDVAQIVLIILKLFNLIDWSWWAVLTPLWISLALLFILFVFVYRSI